MFTELSPLLDIANLTFAMSKKDGLITVSIIPVSGKDQDQIRPMNITGTPEELDEQLIGLLHNQAKPVVERMVLNTDAATDDLDEADKEKEKQAVKEAERKAKADAKKSGAKPMVKPEPAPPKTPEEALAKLPVLLDKYKMANKLTGTGQFSSAISMVQKIMKEKGITADMKTALNAKIEEWTERQKNAQMSLLDEPNATQEQPAANPEPVAEIEEEPVSDDFAFDPEGEPDPIAEEVEEDDDTNPFE